MHIDELMWDDYRIEHIAKHEVDSNEVWEVCEDSAHWAHREGRNRYRLYGQTMTGRYLLVILERIDVSVFRPITARDLTEGEKRSFKKLRK